MKIESYEESMLKNGKPSVLPADLHQRFWDSKTLSCRSAVSKGALHFAFPQLSHLWSRSGQRYVKETGIPPIPFADRRPLWYLRSGTVNGDYVPIPWRSLGGTTCQYANSSLAYITALKIPLPYYNDTALSASWLGRIPEKVNALDFDWAVALGERRELAASVSALGRTIVSSYRSLKRGDLKRTRSLLRRQAKRMLRHRRYGESSRITRAAMASLKAVKSITKSGSNAWLTWRYCIRMLMYDAQGIAQSLENDFVPSDFTFTVMSGTKAEHSREVQTFRPSVTVVLGPTISLPMAIPLRCETQVYGHVKMEYRLTDPKRFLFAQMVPELDRVLWDLLPGSFILDWFVNFGDWLESCTWSGLTWKSGYFTRVARSLLLSSPPMRGSHPSLGTIDFGSLTPMGNRVYSARRYVWSSQPRIPLVWKLEGWIGGERFTDTLSLLRQNPKALRLLTQPR